MDTNGIYIANIKKVSFKNFNNIKNIGFINENGNVYPWTIFLGNNGTGKTNLLKILSCMEAEENAFESEDENFKSYKSACYPKSTINLIHDVKLDLIQKEKIFQWESKSNSEQGIRTGKLGDGLLVFKIYAYGVNRRVSKKVKLSSDENIENNETLFNHNTSLINLNEWLLQTDYAVKNGQESAQKRLNLIRKVITGDIFPEIKDFRFHSNEQLNNSVQFETDEGWFKLDDLAYGYQSTLSWIIDFCKKMFDRYPNSENPLKEPAIVLIDEIDLHLHPEWQRNITLILSNLFPKTQFIATTHSPLVIQSLEEANVYVLNKEEKHVTINRIPNKTFKGWSVEDILNKVMGLQSRVKSDAYLNLMELFDKGLDNFDYETSKKAYDDLMNILPENDIQRRILDMQIKQFPEAR
ncbi:AAA family ATPase [Tenacibaculum maritimum]|uniref:AAA family ATPase n=1 Tax=Tenacibaculum maritimum TaxID=107401 RepID=UPI0012E6BEEC|nr:AAA family ATPase [Tenacibaculum maritimum]CAA0252977.1 conserved hypothetical protein [Tenacibaculum maritimum]